MVTQEGVEDDVLYLPIPYVLDIFPRTIAERAAAVMGAADMYVRCSLPHSLFFEQSMRAQTCQEEREFPSLIEGVSREALLYLPEEACDWSAHQLRSLNLSSDHTTSSTAGVSPTKIMPPTQPEYPAGFRCSLNCEHVHAHIPELPEDREMFYTVHFRNWVVCTVGRGKMLRDVVQHRGLDLSLPQHMLELEIAHHLPLQTLAALFREYVTVCRHQILNRAEERTSTEAYVSAATVSFS